MHTGKLPELLRLYETVIDLQAEVLGGFVGAFTTEVGALSTYTHLWRYDSLRGPAAPPRRRSSAATTGRRSSSQAQPLIHTQHNRILLPTSFSPIR